MGLTKREAEVGEWSRGGDQVHTRGPAVEQGPRRQAVSYLGLTTTRPCEAVSVCAVRACVTVTAGRCLKLLGLV